MASEFTALLEANCLSAEAAAARLKVSRASIYRWKREGDAPHAVLELLRREATPAKAQQRSFTFIDLFSGIGGMRRALEDLEGQCVASCEIDEKARLTYSANFGDGPNHFFPADITEVDPSAFPDHDFLVAGFPCQPFSIAGVSKKNALGRPHGFDCKTQGTLFHNLAAIIEAKKPKGFLLENVKNLVSHDKKRTFATIREVLEEDLPYRITARVIDAKPWVPQHRERIIIVGFHKELMIDFDLRDLILPSVDSGPRLSSILHESVGDDPDPEGRFVAAKGAPHSKYTLTPHLWRYLEDYRRKHELKGNGFGFGLVGPDDVSRTLSARYYKDGSEILVRQKGTQPRRLTPRECARLMGFDEPGRPEFRIPKQVSDTQAYKQFGNAVVPAVVKAVAKVAVPLAVGGQLRLPMAAGAVGSNTTAD